MGLATRNWIIFAVLFGGVGVLLVLLGLGVDLGRWWPLFFVIVGLASIARGVRERGNVVLGLMLMGWGADAIVSLHGPDLGIDRAFWFFLGVAILWVPVAWLLGRAFTPDNP
ncbi:hypothetical protein GF402_00130 [Candidatus Fermentibacteria bacterium]|nr:hypothetical protein [Candidatus Fermentibacteria bacterium]